MAQNHDEVPNRKGWYNNGHRYKRLSALLQEEVAAGSWDLFVQTFAAVSEEIAPQLMLRKS
jgi:hypothetical protein